MSENIISFSSADFEAVGCDRRQALRFMGCKDSALGEELEKLYCECVEEIKNVCSFRAVWKKSSVSFTGDDTVEFDFGRITSAALCKNLEGCSSAYVFAATAGIGVDRLMLRYKSIDPVKAMTLSAIGSSCVECWCDIINEEITKGKESKPRFSPGYGGVELKHQKEILDFLDVHRQTGITLSEAFFMTPVKSVTAFIGIKEE